MAILIGPAELCHRPIGRGLETAPPPVLLLGTEVEAVLLVLVALEEVVVGALLHLDQGEVHGGEVAQVDVLLQPDPAPLQGRQARQPNLLHLKHLEDDQGVVVEEVVAADHGEVREQFPQGQEVLDAEQHEVVGDHAQLRKAQSCVVAGLRTVDQENLEAALDDGAVFELGKVRHLVSDVQGFTDCKEREETERIYMSLFHVFNLCFPALNQ